MSWDLKEAIGYYQKQGAPADQTAVLNLLREVQRESGGSIPKSVLTTIAQSYGVKEGLFLALIRRIPSLRLGEGHILEICAGPNCPKRADLASLARKLASPEVTVKTVPCMRLCGKGPNIRWDGVLHHRADEALIRKLLGGKQDV